MPDDFLQAKGVDRAVRDMTGVSKRAADIKKASFKVRTIYRQSEEKRFQSRGRGTWPPLKESTKESKARHNYDPRVMRATNALHRALTSPRARGQIDERDTDEFRFGTDIPYARYHDTGQGVPQRKLIELTPAERQDISDALGDFIAKGETR